MNSPRLRHMFAPIARRIFTPEYLDIVAGTDFSAVSPQVTEDAIKLLSTLCASVSKLKAFINTADAAILASVYDRYQRVDDFLASRSFHLNLAGTLSDGAAIKLLLIDVFAMLPPF